MNINVIDYLNLFRSMEEVPDKLTANLPGRNRLTKSKKSLKKKNPALILGNVGLVYSLSNLDIPVYVGAEKGTNPSFYSRFVKGRIIFSSYRNEKFIDELCKFGKTLNHKAVIFSDDDDALLTISKYRERLEPYFHFLFPLKELVNNVLDKHQFSRITQAHNLPVPASFEVSTLDELHKYSELCDYPCIIKPVYRSDWYHEDFEGIVGEYKKAYRCDDEEELTNMYQKVSQIDKKVVLQEYIAGDDSHHYSVNMYVDKNGEVRGCYIAKKLRIYPIGAGMGSFIRVVKDDEMVEKAKEIAEALNLRGLLNIQFKKDSRTGEPKLIEIHFRNSIWGYIGVAADINLYEFYYHGLTGEELNSCQDYNEEVKYVDLYKDFAGFMQYRAAGELNLLKWLKTFNGKLVVGDWKWSDPVPFIIIFWLSMVAQFKGIAKKT